MTDRSIEESGTTASLEQHQGDLAIESRDTATATDATGPTAPPRRRPRRGPRVLVVLGVLVIAALAVAIVGILVWTVGRSTDSQTETFSGPIDRVIVEDVNGRVTFEAGEGTQLTIEQEWLFGDAPHVQIIEDGGTLRITADCGSFCQTHITGTAPANAKISVQTHAGYIDVTGFTNGVDLNTSAGHVHVSDISGNARLRSDAGSIRGNISDGNVDAQTSAGMINLEVVGDFSRISAVSDAGSVDLTVPDHVYRVEAETSAGRTDVNVSTAPDAARVIIARSSAGDVTINQSAGMSS